MAKGRIRVFLVDDHELTRQGLRRILELEEDMEVVGEAASAEEALEMVADLSPDIVLMDIKMPNTNGVVATRQLKARGLSGEVIILSLYDGYLAQAIEAGAAGYLTKDMKREDLTNAIRRVHQGEMVLAQGLLTSPNLVESALQSFREMVRRRRTEDEPSPPASGPGPSLGETGDGEGGHKPRHRREPEGPETPLPTEVPRPPIDQGPAVPQNLPPEEAEAPPFRAVETAAGESREPALPQETLEGPSRGSRGTPEKIQKLEQGEYTEEALVVISPPVEAASLARLFQKLWEYPQVEIVATGGSWDEGAWMKLRLKKSSDLTSDLKGLLAHMPEVAQVWEAALEEGNALRNAEALRTSSITPGLQLRLLLKTTDAPGQLHLTI